MRIFVDATVLYSAARCSAGRSRALVRLGETGRCRLITSPHVIEEATRNTRLVAPAGQSGLDDLLAAVERVPEAPLKLVAWTAAEGVHHIDAPVLAAAVAGRADCLVTGDRTRLGRLAGRDVGGVTVLSLRDALARLLEAAEG